MSKANPQRGLKRLGVKAANRTERAARKARTPRPDIYIFKPREAMRYHDAVTRTATKNAAVSPTTELPAAEVTT